MIERILPPGAVAAELFADEPAALFPEEEAVIARATQTRRREFTSVRVCARRAMAALGQPPVPLVPGEWGAPRWPGGVTGSLTHCEGYRGCVAARTEDVASVGLDAEPNQALPPRVHRMVALPAEREHTGALACVFPGVCWDRLLFSAKEAVYKAWSPVTSRWLGFRQASIEFSPAAGGGSTPSGGATRNGGRPADGSPPGEGDVVEGTFTARFLVPAPVPSFTGRWLCSGPHVLTLVLNDATR